MIVTMTEAEFDNVLLFIEENSEALIRYFYSKHTESCIQRKIRNIDCEDLWIMLDDCEREKILGFMKRGEVG